MQASAREAEAGIPAELAPCLVGRDSAVRFSDVEDAGTGLVDREDGGPGRGIDMQGRRAARRVGSGPGAIEMPVKPEEVDCRFSYLLGSHIRYGKGNSFKLANASHKVKLIIEFLESLGASWIRWSWTVGTAPVGHRIEFGPDAVLTRLLALDPAQAGRSGISHAGF